MSGLSIEVVPVESLSPDPANARRHSDRNLEAIAGSLRRFGQRRPLVVTSDGIVLAGNGTLEAAKSIGWTEIAVTRVPGDWSYEQARAFALADNRTAELASWDDGLLAEQLLELDAVGWDIAEIGFAPLHPPTGDRVIEDFPSFDEDTKTQFRCPKCAYEWNGSPR